MLQLRSHLRYPLASRIIQRKCLSGTKIKLKSAQIELAEFEKPVKTKRRGIKSNKFPSLQDSEGICRVSERISSSSNANTFKTEDELLEASLCEENDFINKSTTRQSETFLQDHSLTIKTPIPRFPQKSITSSYIQACCHGVGLDVALEVFIKELKSTASSYKTYPIIDSANTLLEVISKQGTFQQAKFVMEKLEKFLYDPSVETLALWLICLEKEGELEYQNVRFKFLQDLKMNNILIEELWTDALLTHSNLPTLLRAIGRLDPSLPQKFEDQSFRDQQQSWYHNYDPHNPLFQDFDQKMHNCKPKTFMTEEQMMQAVEDQYKAQEDLLVDLSEITNDLMSQEMTLSHKRQEMLNNWKEVMEIEIENFMESQKKSFEKFIPSKRLHQPFHVYPFLATITVSQLQQICFKHIEHLIHMEKFYPCLSIVHLMIGKDVNSWSVKNNEDMDSFEKEKIALKEYCCDYLKGGTQDVPRVRFMNLIYKHKIERSFLLGYNQWNPMVLLAIGKEILKFITNTLTVTTTRRKKTTVEPVFYSVEKMNSGTHLECHPLVMKEFEMAHTQTTVFPVDLLPSVCPPVPWVCHEAKGYTFKGRDLIRSSLKPSVQRRMIRDISPQNLYPVLDSLNMLGSVPWRINERLLDIIISIFKDGGNMDLGIVRKSENVKPLSSKDFEGLSPLERRRMFVEHKTKVIKENGYYSQRCDYAYKLACAQHFRDKVFWLPSNLDFRGRVYPIAPHLTHISSDLFRSLLLFAEGQELGTSGLEWLKTHVINLSGLKKRNSLAERLQFFDENLDAIMDSADNPIDGQKWWLQGDDPWQTLAACMEITNALRSPDPEKFISYLPVHQDGSCNGLQHYAALGRDYKGAFSVNLCDGERPEDVYTAIALLTEELRKADAENGCPIAKRLEGCITRKVVKQTIMTTVYGVTTYGAQLQVKKKLENHPIEAHELNKSSKFIVKHIFAALKDMFTNTKEIQNWFGECCDYICKEQDASVHWITPLGLPIHQPYYKSKLGLFNMPICEDFIRSPSVLKHKNAFPPNFIHSLDSSHMMLTSLRCQQNGLTFASIHDCFWTHAADIDELSKFCREEFVHLHSRPILEDLAEYFKKCYAPDLSNTVFDKLPTTGQFDLNNVLKSTFFFS